MAGVAAFGDLRFHTIEPNELSQALQGWMHHCLTPEGLHEAPAARNITLRLVGILGHTNLAAIMMVVEKETCPHWTSWRTTISGHCDSEKRLLH